MLSLSLSTLSHFPEFKQASSTFYNAILSHLSVILLSSRQFLPTVSVGQNIWLGWDIFEQTQWQSCKQRIYDRGIFYLAFLLVW